MKKINLKGISESLSDNEMKQVKGGDITYEVDDSVIKENGGGGDACTKCTKQSDCSDSQICAKVQGRCNDQYFCW